MKYHVCTLMYGSAFERYGRKFLTGALSYLDTEVQLHVVHDGTVNGFEDTSISYYDLDTLPHYKSFMKNYEFNDRANGKNIDGAKLDENGVSWRHNAVKWAPQAFAPFAVSDQRYQHNYAQNTKPEDGGVFIWLDADIVITSLLSTKWLDKVIGNADVTYLGRPNQHPEIGWYSFKIDKHFRELMDLWSCCYSSGAVFEFKEWHSAYTWGLMLDRYTIKKENAIIKNLNTSLGRGHVWPDTILAEKTVHLKGKRKG